MDKDTIWVVTGEPTEVRGGELTEFNIKALSVNINLFLQKIGSVLEETPENVGKFKFEEFEVHAEVTAEGSIALFGTGGKVGAAGGLRFVFRRTSMPGDEK